MSLAGNKIKLLKEIFSLPKIRISFQCKDEEDRKLFKHFTKPHPKFLIWPNKSVGVELILLSAFPSFEDYLKSVSGKNSAAYYSRKCSKEGYVFRPFDANQYQNKILDIHRSASSRQGRDIDLSYLDEKMVYPADEKNEYFGIYEGDELVAYCWLRFQGEFVIMNRILGHHSHLKKGIMYLLVTSVVEYLIKEKPGTGFLMYDTYFGASEGLKLFKSRTGFKPYFVSWKK